MAEWLDSSSDLYTWLILPLIIFSARVIEVCLNTIRVIFIARGYKLLAAFSGFGRALVWLVALGQIMQNLSNPMCYIAFTGGFVAGNYVGIYVAERMSLGVVLIRIITHLNTDALIESLKQGKYGVTVTDGQGSMGPTTLIFTIVQRQAIQEVLDMVQTHTPNAFYTVADISSVRQGTVAPWKFPGKLLLPER